MEQNIKTIRFKISHLLRILLPLLVLLLTFCGPAKSPEPESDIEKAPTNTAHWFWVFKPTVNIRKANTVRSDNIARLADGDSVLVLENVDGWYRIRHHDLQNGWIRSDLLGPKQFSPFSRAVRFVDSLKVEAGIDLFFDKQQAHKRIYLRFPESQYNNASQLRRQANTLINTYQRRVYPGAVTARILKARSDDEFLTLEQAGVPNADPVLPVIPFGRLSNVSRPDPLEISLTVEVEPEVADKELLAAARKMAATYPISYRRVEIYFHSRSECRLWFKEDAGGEQHKFGNCP